MGKKDSKLTVHITRMSKYISMGQESHASQIANHYSSSGLFESIIAELSSKGIKFPSRNDLAGYDEFHVRGAEVSLELAKESYFQKHARVLDLGCGLGGASRMIADFFDCHVTGIDITPEFVRSAELLSQLLGFEGKTRFLVGDATDLPFSDNSFDAVWTQHVQMNIKHKKKLYEEIKRILTAGGCLIYYDIFKRDAEPLFFPVPWAEKQSLSFLISISAYSELLTNSGYVKFNSKDQTKEGIIFIKKLLSKMNTPSGSKPGLHLIMGNTFSLKMQNLLKNLEEGRIELQSGIYQKT